MSAVFFRERPSTMSRERFLERFGSIYEHAPWVAESVWESGVGPEHDRIAVLAAALAAVVATADEALQLALVRAHPDLAGKAALRGELTAASTHEQSSVGLDRCSPEEFGRFQRLNAAYRDKFGFPFILAIKGRTRSEVLDAFEHRLNNSRTQELKTALEQIDRIALLRLQDV